MTFRDETDAATPAGRDFREVLRSAAVADSMDDEPGRWAGATVASVRSALAERARRTYRRRVAGALAAALLPLPLIVAYDGALLGWLHSLASRVLPEPLPTLAVSGYAGAAALLLAATYAAIPVLVEKTLSPRRMTP